MADKTFNDVKINLTLKPQSERANVSSSQEDLAVQMGKIQQWYSGLNNYSTCATAAATAIKTVDCPGFELTTGTVVIVKFTVTNTAAVADLQLNVNGTGAKGIKYRNANLSAASVLTANRIYAMLYDGTYWQIIGDLDTNSNTYDRTSVQTRIYAGAKGVFPYSLCALDTAQRMQAFTTTGGTGTSKAFNSSEKFLYPPVIMYHSANSTIANGSVIANNVLYEQYPSVNMQYNANVTTSSAYSQYKPLYIECTFDTNGYWSPTGITQTFTSGKYYILLGCMYNTSIYQLALFAYHPLYYYDGTNLINGELHLQDGRYLPMAGGTMDNSAEITIPNGSHSSQYTGFGMYHYIGAGNGWARGINVNSATDGTRFGSLGMYGNANATEPLYAYFGKTYNDAWYYLYKNIFRIQDAEDSDFHFQYRPASLSSGYSGSFLSLYACNTYGYGIVLGHTHGGLTIVGSGESSKAFVDTAFTSTTTPYGSTVFQFDSEELVLTSDAAIWFVSGANGLSTSTHTDWTNLKTALFDSSGNFRPSVDNKGSIGTSSYKWASIHSTTIYENGTSLASKYAAIGHTHSSLNVGNVGNSNTPVYFSNGAPTAVTTPASGAWWSSEPHIDSSGVLEIGRYIDFHATNASTNNYDVRLDASSTNMVTMNSASGSTTLRIAGTLPMLRFQQTTSGKAYDNTSCGIWCRPADTNGVNMFMQSGGCIMIGAGEFASGAYSRKDSTGTTQTGYDNIANSTAERLYLGADGEVHIISNGQNIATYSNNDHRVWKFNTSGQLITPGFIADTLDLQHTMLQQNLRSAPNCVTLAEWIVDGAASTTYKPGISFHNTGGDSTDKGAIILRPYHHNTDPWASGHPVGLYIGKNMLSLDGVNVALQNATSLNTMINALGTGSSAPVDADYYVSQYAGGGTTTTTYHRRPVSALYSYIRSKHIKSAIAVQTGSSKKAKITLQTLMTWLITTKKYIPSGTTEDIIIKTTWAYANNDILRFNANGVDYEMSLAGVIIEFKGLATSYNTGEFTFTITSAPAVLSDAPTSGYTRFPANTTAVYHCNGSSYNPTWTVNMNKAVQTLLYSSTSSAGYGYADIVIGSVFSIWSVLLLEFMEASYGYSNENPHSGSGLIPLSLVRSLGNVSDISQQYQIPIGYNPGNTTANQYISVVYTDESTFRLSRGGSGGPIGKLKIYGIC